jgi:tRNA threonylcarbamoyladenosine biosynthesis protein TsaE
VKTFVFDIHGLSGTDQFGRFLAELMPDGGVVALAGPLGSGKTRLVQSVAEHCGVENGTVVSPTFMLIHEYNDGRCPIYHFDVYRLENEEEFRRLSPDDYFEGGGFVFIEWADKFPAVLPADYLEIRIEIINETDRRFHLTPHGQIDILLERE